MRTNSFVFDIEGIILDFKSAFIMFINKCLHKNYTVMDLKCYDIKKDLNLSRSMYELMLEEFYKSDFSYNMPIINQATAKILSKLRKFHKTIFISSFPRKLNLKVVANLWANNVLFDKIIYTDCIHNTLYQYKAVFYISDNPHHLKDVLSVSPNPVGYVFALIRDYNTNELNVLIERYKDIYVFNSVRDMLYVIRDYCRKGTCEHGRIRK